MLYFLNLEVHMKLHNFPLYACAMLLSVFMLSKIADYHSNALVSASRTDDAGIFVDVSMYDEEDAVLAFASQQEKAADFYYPLEHDMMHAFTKGTVVLSEENVIVIAHNSELSTRYSGCTEILVAVGDPVDAGRLIAKTDETGQFEVLYCGKSVDTSLYLALTARS